MEIKFFHKTFTEQNPKPLMEHMQRMASGEAPFFPATLSLVIGTLARKVLPRPITSGSRLGKSREVWDQSVAETAPAITPSSSTPNVDPPLSPSITPSSSSQDLASVSGPSGTDNHTVSLICLQCGQTSSLGELYAGLRCPLCRCPPKNKGGKKVYRRPYMQCPLCNTSRTTLRSYCLGSDCEAVFA